MTHATDEVTAANASRSTFCRALEAEYAARIEAHGLAGCSPEDAHRLAFAAVKELGARLLARLRARGSPSRPGRLALAA